MSYWEQVRERIKARSLTSSTWLSDFRSLEMIIDTAERLGIDPANALRASISNLRTIIKPAKDAIFDNAIDDIRKLFELAGDLNNRELRDHLGGNEREIVIYRSIKAPENITYEISLSEDQFITIQASTKYKITFQEQKIQSFGKKENI